MDGHAVGAFGKLNGGMRVLVGAPAVLHLCILDDMLLHMRTSVDIPDPLLQRAKKLAQERGVSVRQLLIDGLRAVVERDPKAGTHRMKDCSFGQGGLVAGLAWTDSERLNELTYEE